MGQVAGVRETHLGGRLCILKKRVFWQKILENMVHALCEWGKLKIQTLRMDGCICAFFV